MMSYFYEFTYKSILSGIAAVIFLMLPVSVSAQGEGYRIGHRDVLSLAIYAGGEEQQSVVVSVDTRGIINVPFIGPVKADGMTLSELQMQIREPLARDFFVDPEVILHIKEYHSLYYYISGAVASPGLYETTSKITLMQLIAKAGGVLPERQDKAYILRDAAKEVQEGEKPEDLIVKRDSREEVDLQKLLDQVDMSQNIMLQPGDVIYIPLKDENEIEEEKPSVYVEGEVRSPGAYNYKYGMTALNACILAGGFSKYAAPNRTRIIRKKEEEQIIIRINLDDVKKGRKNDVELEPGDMIHVPESWF